LETRIYKNSTKKKNIGHENGYKIIHII